MPITQPVWDAEEIFSTIPLYVEPYTSIIMPTTESKFAEPSVVEQQKRKGESR